MATERLYYNDSHLTEFEAQVVAVTERVSGWVTVILDRTAFYPTGGGQPSDTGTLNDTRVAECIDAEDQGVLHVLQGRGFSVGEVVRGSVNWPRRLDHIQQHTGQHILSQAFIALFGAETRGFRMLDQYSEIDLALDDPTVEKIDRAVELANRIIWENRSINIQRMTKEKAASLPLRKDSAREGELRLIEIEGFDLTPCGGTHARASGEVGVIAIRSFERAKGLTRVEFVAGGRALADYDRANRTARSIASLFSAARDETPALLERLLDENKQLTRRVRSLEEITAGVEAEELLADAPVMSMSREDLRDEVPPGTHGHEVPAGTHGDEVPAGTHEGEVPAGTHEGEVPAGTHEVKLCVRVFDGRDAESLKKLALALIAHPGVIALLGSSDEDAARLVFARSADAPGDMNALMRDACATLDGRGGGRPDMAQGGGRNISKLSEAIELAKQTLSEH